MSVRVEPVNGGEARHRSPVPSIYEPSQSQGSDPAVLRLSPQLHEWPSPTHLHVPSTPQHGHGELSSRRCSSTSSLVSASSPSPAPASPSAPAELPLWCKLQSVIDGGILNRLSRGERKLQESMFEVISSETSYHNSLRLVHSHFQKPLLACCQEASLPHQDPSRCTISESDYNELFYHFEEVFKCSTAFLADLESVLQADVLLSGLCKVIHTHATMNFYPYKEYCSQKIHQDRKLEQLTNQNAAFSALLSELASASDTRGLSLATFLHLPVQRVQRYPMLMATMLKNMTPDHPERESCDKARQTLTTLTQHCDEDAERELQRAKSVDSGGPDQKTSRRRAWRRKGVRRHSVGDSLKKGN